MTDLNPTTRRFSRTLEEAYPATYYGLRRVELQQWFYPHEAIHDRWSEAQFWVYITVAFAAGFLVAMMVYGG